MSSGSSGATGGIPYMALRFTDANGGALSDRILLDIDPGKLEQNGAVAGLQNGAVAVAYEQIDQATFDRQIKLHIHTPNGANVSGVVPVSAAGAVGAFPDIVALENNTVLVAWQQNSGIAARKWVSPSPKYVGAGTDDRVIWGRRDGNRLLGEAMKEQSPSL